MYKIIYQKLSDILELTHSHENKSNISSMEGIRGIAAFLVFIQHYVVVLNDQVGINQQYWLYELFLWLKNIGNVGVELFFVLSGYLIYGTVISKNKPFLTYIGRRIKRIYPTFIAVFVVYLALSVIMPEHNKIPKETMDAAIYLIQNLLFMPPIFSAIDPMITVAWSLSYEVFFYLLIPVVVSVFQLRKWSVNLRIFFFILISLLGFIYYFYYEGPIRMLMFIAGIILYEKVNNKQNDKTIPFIGTLFFILTLVFIVLLMTFKIPHGEWWRTVIIYVGFFMLCYECFSWQSPSAKIFSFTPLRWFGNMSYSYYLTHGLTVKVSIMLFSHFFYTSSISSVFTFVLLGATVYFLTLVPAFLLFIMVEKPFSLARTAK